MEILSLIQDACRNSGIDFLVVGGHAVNAYGLSRQTGDLDLAVRSEDREWWRQMLSGRSYCVRYESPSFLLFRAPQIETWPIDLLLMNDKTINGLIEESRVFRFGTAECLIPSVAHLIAMKLHALRENFRDRQFKDMLDIQELARTQGIDVHSDAFRELCLKFANREIYERFQNTKG